MTYYTSPPSGYATSQGYVGTQANGASATELKCSGYVMPKNNVTSTSWLGAKFAKIALLATLLFSSGGVTTNQQNVSIKFGVPTPNLHGIALKSPNNFSNESAATPSLSNFLKEQFGFKTAQWAAVLQIERKTLYNWEKNPETKIQNKVVERLILLQQFYKHIEQEHAMFISKLTFGKHSDAGFLNAFTDTNMSLESLAQLYDDHYIEIDGLYKRLKHSV